MKYIIWFIGTIGTFLGGIYIIAFTSFGNSVVAPIVEKNMSADKTRE